MCRCALHHSGDELVQPLLGASDMSDAEADGALVKSAGRSHGASSTYTQQQLRAADHDHEDGAQRGALR